MVLIGNVLENFLTSKRNTFRAGCTDGSGSPVLCTEGRCALAFLSGEKRQRKIQADYGGLYQRGKWVYCSGDDLCFADVRTVVSIPVSAIAGTEIRSKRVRVPEWNKEQAPNAKEHEPYRVTKTMASTSSARTPPCRPMTCSATTRSSSPITIPIRSAGYRTSPSMCEQEKQIFCKKSLAMHQML